jgi:hypothetical protein
MEGDFSTDLRAYYSLPPGRYVIVASERKDGQPVPRIVSNPSNGLWVEITAQ